ncbi:MAG: response regulator transcription factor [Chloroflexi bacterium]|nr:response regulator transcription factor [Chloroflexota bacterium]
MEPIKIILAEDHPLMREGMRRALEGEPDMAVVGEAEDGEQALQLIRDLKPDIAIVDIHLPKLNGIAVARRLRDHSPGTRALMLTAYDDDDYILALMEIGVWGYLLKTSRTEEVVKAVRTVRAGEAVLDPTIAAKVARLWAHHKISSKSDFAKKLSSRELEVLEMAAAGLRNKDIADRLRISPRTVERHFSSIFGKLQVSSRVEAVLFAISHHLVIPEEDKRTAPR